MISQKKIAQMLNLNQSTVSVALRGESDGGTIKVSPETRQLVLETAQKLGYRQNRYASVLKSGKSRLIAVVHGALSADWIDKTQAVCAAVEESEYLPWNIDFLRYRSRPEALTEKLLDLKAEGVIVASTVYFDLKPLFKAGIPVVALQAPRLRKVPYIGPDKVEGFYQVAKHLVEQGCRRIVVCGSGEPERFVKQLKVTAAEALMGLEECLAEAGIEPPFPPLVMLPRDASEIRRDDYEMGRLLAKEAFKHRPDALMFSNDSSALGGMTACRDAGLRIPEDICVTGFNSERQGEYAWIPLTTVEQPVQAMAHEAVAALVRQIEDPALPRRAHTILHPCRLIPRRSSLRALGRS